MKYIDAEKTIERLKRWKDKGMGYGSLIFVFKQTVTATIELIEELPAADVVEVVRCRECVMWDGSFTLNGQKKCLNMAFCTDGDFYCGWGSKE